MKYIVWLILSNFIFISFAQNDSWIQQKLVSSEVEITTAKKSIRSIGTSFTTCSSDLNAFSDYPWFLDFKNAFWSINIVTEWSSLFWVDICFSPSLQKVIVNVPFVFTNLNGFLCSNWGDIDHSLCKDTVNIYSYHTEKKVFTKASLDTETIIYQAQKWLEDYVPAVNQVILHNWFWWYDNNIDWFQHADMSTALRWFEKEKGNNIILSSSYSDAGHTQEYVWQYDYVNNIISLLEDKWWSVEELWYSEVPKSLPTTGPKNVFLIFLVILSLFVGINWKYYKL